MREIQLTKGKVALVDDDVFKRISKYKWHYAEYRNGKGYAKTNNKGGNPALLRMHRLVLRLKRDEKIDHINGNSLDNRRKNLRIANQSQNMMNTGLRSTNKSGYKGVCFAKRENKWLATIWKDRKQIYLGFFVDKKEAALAYNEAAIKLHGDFALLNSL